MNDLRHEHKHSIPDKYKKKNNLIYKPNVNINDIIIDDYKAAQFKTSNILNR